MSDIAIQTQNLTKIFKGDLGVKPVVGVDNLNLEVRKGEVYAFLGPNGAGKTTTIKLLMRLLYPTQGAIRLLGCENKYRSAMEPVGYLPEQPRLYDYLSGREFLDFIARLFNLDTAVRKQRVSELLDRVGLQKRAGEAIRGYSRGMNQRLGLAQALINDPQLLVLDEPMASLDPLGRRDFRDLILDLKKKGKTIFFSSHILSDAEMVADRVCILNQGKQVSIGSLDELIRSNKSNVEVTFDLSPEKQTKVSTYNPVINERTVLINLESEKEVPEFLKQIDKWGGQVISIVPRRLSLEDLFMSEIGR